MSYQVHCLSTYTPSSRSFNYNREYLGDGINCYTVYTYKSSQVEVSYDSIIDNKNLSLYTVYSTVKMNADYVPESIIETHFWNNQHEGSAEDYVQVNNGVIELTHYLVDEDYSRTIADKAADVLEEMFYFAFNGNSFEQFANSNARSVDIDSESVKEYYETIVDAVEIINRYYTNVSIRCSALNWNYSTDWYINGTYSISVNVESSTYLSGSNEPVNTEEGMVSFQFKVAGDNILVCGIDG